MAPIEIQNPHDIWSHSYTKDKKTRHANIARVFRAEPNPARNYRALAGEKKKGIENPRKKSVPCGLCPLKHQHIAPIAKRPKAPKLTKMDNHKGLFPTFLKKDKKPQINLPN